MTQGFRVSTCEKGIGHYSPPLPLEIGHGSPYPLGMVITHPSPPRKCSLLTTIPWTLVTTHPLSPWIFVMVHHRPLGYWSILTLSPQYIGHYSPPPPPHWSLLTTTPLFSSCVCTSARSTENETDSWQPRCFGSRGLRIRTRGFGWSPWPLSILVVFRGGPEFSSSSSP